MQDFNFYKVNETLNHKYYQIPQEWFINPLYKNTLKFKAFLEFWKNFGLILTIYKCNQ